MTKITKTELEEIGKELDAERTGLGIDRIAEISTLVTKLLRIERDMLLASTGKQVRVERILIEVIDSDK
jgi:hypothetical protein